ncbi:MAG: cupin domain-containing protein [Clostridia bacterium]|nr:cupin domain-containing protein [Clostridia bacterium]
MKIGEKLRRLRQQRNLTQEELADRCELTKGFISQVERDLASPSIATLTDMLECLGSDLKTFFSEADEDEKVVFSIQDMFEKIDEEALRGSILWLVPSAQKNEMEPILMSIGPGGASQEFPPHEGEEFGYVLSGAVTLYNGDKKLKVKTGDSFCLHPTAPHHVENPGKRAAKVLWISTPPSF